MARHNNVQLYGTVATDPKIIKDSDGNPLQGLCTLTVIRGIRDIGEKIDDIKYAHPAILTKNVDLIKEMETWKKNDMVEIKGTMTTKTIKKTKTCPNCGTKNGIQGEFVYINPIYLSARERNNSDKRVLELLRQRCEISNNVMLIGSLCREPKYYAVDGKGKQAQYQLAINRSYHIKEDSADIKTDYPWIYSYGEIAENDAAVMHTGTLVLVDGMIRTREIKERKLQCENCGEIYTFQDTATEVVPYKTEYLQNFYSFEDKEKMEQNLLQNTVEEIFGDN